MPGASHDSAHPLAAALRVLRARGFVSLPRAGTTRYFEGPLVCKDGVVRIRIAIRDWDFVSYPSIRVLQAPQSLQGVTPHIDAAGGLCYLASGTVILDRYHPEHAIAQCLDLARQELDRLAKKPVYRQEEFQSEFGANWYLGQLPLPWDVSLGSLARDSQVAAAYGIGPPDERLIAISDNADEIGRLCAVRGWPEPTPLKATCAVIRSDAWPTIPTIGLPTTVSEVFGWIRDWDRHAYGAIQSVLGQRRCLSNHYAIFLLHTRAGWFGFSFKIDATKRLAYSRKPTDFRQSLHRRNSTLPINRVAVREISADFVHSRNLTFPSLKGRSITLIGCGAIGGYLAQALARLGAGTGGGELTLIDPEPLGPENLGRHWLGYDSLFTLKAEAVKQRIEKEFPESRVQAHVRRAEFPLDIRGDLIVDATGEEAFSEALNYHRQQLDLVRRPLTLHTWIMGNGDCAQALWVDLPKFACYRCLRCNDPERTPRFPILEHPPETLNLGCHAFTPYAVSAPMTAAALATDLVIGWMSGDPSPRFRTRVVEGAELRKVKSQNLSPLVGCPACSSH
jgi:hypothetical protein